MHVPLAVSFRKNCWHSFEHTFSSAMYTQPTPHLLLSTGSGDFIEHDNCMSEHMPCASGELFGKHEMLQAVPS
jgi:hypothetical protein